MYMYTCVCMYVQTYVCTCVRLYVRTHVRMYIHMWVGVVCVHDCLKEETPRKLWRRPSSNSRIKGAWIQPEIT